MYVPVEALIIGLSLFVIIFCVCIHIADRIFDRFIRPKLHRGDESCQSK